MMDMDEAGEQLATLRTADGLGIRRLVRLIDLVDDPTAIAAYEHAHASGNTPGEVLASSRGHGIVDVSIYRYGPRLVMILDVTDDFDSDALEAENRELPALVEWQRQMKALQRPVSGETGWVEAHRIFRLSDHP